MFEMPLFALLLMLVNPAQEDRPHQEEITVRLRTIRVHATDKAGNHIPGLTSDDFSLTLDGIEKRLLFFEEVDLEEQVERVARVEEDTSSDQSQADREDSIRETIVLFLDSSMMTEKSFIELCESARRFLQDIQGKQTLFKLVHLDGTFQFETPFTRDSQAPIQALDKLDRKGALWQKLYTSETRISSSIGDWVTTVSSYDPDMVHLSFDNVFSRLRRASRDPTPDVLLKILDTHAQSINFEVNEKARMKKNHMAQVRAGMRYLAQSVRPLPGHKSIYYLGSGAFVEEGGPYVSEGELEQATVTLNTSDVTVYSLFLKHPVSGGADANITGNAYFNTRTFSTRPLFPMVDSPVVDNEVRRNTIIENIAHAKSGPSQYAGRTGGLFLDRPLKDAGTALQDLHRTSRRYYRMGIEPPPSGEARRLKIEYTGDRKPLKLRYGRRFEKRKGFVELEPNELYRDCESALLYGRFSLKNEIVAEASFKRIRGEDGSLILPVVLKLKQPKNKKGYQVGFAAIDHTHGKLDATVSVLPDAQSETPLYFYDILTSAQVPAFIRFFVRDLDNGKASLYSLPIGPERSGLLMLADDSVKRIMPLNQLRDAEADDENHHFERKLKDPFFFGEFVFMPSDTPAFPMEAGTVGYALVSAHGFEPNEARLFLVDETGKTSRVSFDLHRARKVLEAPDSLAMRFRLPNVLGGNYRLVFEYPEGENFARLERVVQIQASAKLAGLNAKQVSRYLFEVMSQPVEQTRSNLASRSIGFRVRKEMLHSMGETGSASKKGNLVKRADLNLVDEFGNSLLMAAVRSNDPEWVRLFLKQGAAVNVRNNLGATPLMMAAVHANTDILRQLAKADAQPDLADNYGNTAMFYALAKANSKTIKQLVKMGVPMNATNFRGETVLFEAIRKGRHQTVALLLDNGARTDITTKLELTPLMVAARHGKLKTMKKLVEAGSDPNERNKAGITPFMLAALNERMTALSRLHELGATVDLQGMGGNTALSLVADMGLKGLVAPLARMGADLNHVNNSSESPLMLSVIAKHDDTLQELLNMGADPNRGNRGITALTLAVRNGYTNMAKKLVKAGANPKAKDDQGQDLRYYADLSGNKKMNQLVQGWFKQ